MPVDFEYFIKRGYGGGGGANNWTRKAKESNFSCPKNEIVNMSRTGCWWAYEEEFNRLQCCLSQIWLSIYITTTWIKVLISNLTEEPKKKKKKEQESYDVVWDFRVGVSIGIYESDFDKFKFDS